MSAAAITQMLTPSLRRVYRSRAWCRAISGSAACRLPTCTWLRPRLPRRNTSYNGHAALASVMGRPGVGRARSGRWTLCLWPPGFRRVRERGLPDPGALVVRRLTARDALGVARAVAGDHGLELGPVDGAEVVVAAFFVPPQLRVGQRDAELVRLGDAHVDEALAQLVVGMPLDAPLHRLLGVGRVLVGRAEHHQRRPPVAVGRVWTILGLGWVACPLTQLTAAAN